MATAKIAPMSENHHVQAPCPCLVANNLPIPQRARVRWTPTSAPSTASRCSRVEDEQALARALPRRRRPRRRASDLVLSHLRFVVHVARGYNGYGLQHRRPDPGRQHRPDEGGQALRPRPRRAPGQLRGALDPRRDARVHPQELAHRQGRHHQGAAQAVLQPAQVEEAPGLVERRPKCTPSPRTSTSPSAKCWRWSRACPAATSASTLPADDDDDHAPPAPAAYLIDARRRPVAGLRARRQRGQPARTAARGHVRPRRALARHHQAPLARADSKVDAAGTGRRVRRVRRAHPPGRSQRAEEDAGAVRAWPSTDPA